MRKSGEIVKVVWMVVLGLGWAQSMVFGKNVVKDLASSVNIETVKSGTEVFV